MDNALAKPSPIRRLSSLMLAAFFVHASNAAITTMIGIVIARDGGEQSAVALIASCYSLGFLAGCFLVPRHVARIGLVRGFVVSTAVLTVTIVAMDLSHTAGLWAILRFLMGAAMAAVLAICDAWINSTTPNEQRGSTVAIYGIVMGLASLVSQFVFLVVGVGENFVLYFAIVMNLAVVVVALTVATAPDLPQVTARSLRPFTSVSMVANIAAFVSGFMNASLISILPFYLTDHGVSARRVAMALGALYLGRLAFQWPVGRVSDRFDRRSVLAGLSIGVGLLMIVSLSAGEGEGRALTGDAGAAKLVLAFLLAFLIGGMLSPIYSVASALAFDRAEGRRMIDISTTLHGIHAIGSIAGPFTVILVSRALGDTALMVCMLVASAFSAMASVIKRVAVEGPEQQASALPLEPQSSLDMVNAAAKLAEEQTEEAGDGSAG